MKFSIIIPVYNAAQNLSACLDSVLRQTYRELEMILVDDGSTDESGTICDQYKILDPARVKVIHNENQGPLKARACGIANATGDVVLFVDSDDALRLDALEKLRPLFDQDSCDMVLFNASLNEDFSIPYPGFSFKNGQRFQQDEKKVLYELMITTSMLNSLCLKAVRRSVAEVIDESFRNMYLKHAEDLLFSMAMLSAAQDIVYLDQNLYYWRNRPGSITHSYNPQRSHAIKKVHKEMERFIDAWNMKHLHSVHYAREVKGWVDCLKLILLNEHQLNHALIQELAEDEYFRNAYNSMKHGFLSKQDALLAGMLFKKRYTPLSIIGAVMQKRNAIKQRMKGKN